VSRSTAGHRPALQDQDRCFPPKIRLLTSSATLRFDVFERAVRQWSEPVHVTSFHVMPAQEVFFLAQRCRTFSNRPVKLCLRSYTLIAFLGLLAVANTSCVSGNQGQNVVHLLNGKDLSSFYSFLTDFGIDSDPNKVFTLTNGLLRISGQHYGYLATKNEYSNYRLVAEFKWGELTWSPRKLNARDSGMLVHGGGKDQVWPTSIECQLIEGGTGDILVVNGAYLTVDGLTKGPKTERFDRPGRNPWKDELGFRGPNEIEKPHGQWNTIEILCKGDKMRIEVNGHKTLEGTNAIPTAGKIVVQSEGAEVFFRRLDLYPLK